MISSVIVDTGPLVAFLNRRDRHHAWAKEQLGRIEPPLFTCESVLSEVCFLLQRSSGGPSAVLELVNRGLIDAGFRLQTEIVAVSKLMNKYASLPISLADACLVRMAELRSSSLVLTLDSDFLVYRKNSRQVIRTLMPKAP